MTITLYDLAGAEDERRFSPYCWRVKMALLRKGLAFDTVAWRFTEKDAIAFSGQEFVPVLIDGGRTVSDSWNIAVYLDEKYPDRPALMDSEQARGAIRAFKFWCERTVHASLMRVIVLDIYARIHEKDAAYFRQSREKRLGKTLEEVGAESPQALVAFRKALDPIRPVLADQVYLGGREPSFADFILFGAFQWSRVVSPTRLLEPDDPVYAWRERLLDAHDGYARKALGYPVWA
jgi:glutathione S-transferase